MTPLNLKASDKIILLHASFDPISKQLEQIVSPQNLMVYNIYGNRHEDEKSIEISNRVFPPNPSQKIVNPSHLDNEDKSVNYILAITSLHEIHTQEKRIQFFKEANRILKDDGVLMICE